MGKVSWTLDELLELFPEQARHSGAVRRCVEPLIGRGRCVRHTAAEFVVASVTLHIEPAAEFSVTIDSRQGALSANRELIVRSLLRGVLDGTTRSQPPAWGCHIKCVEVDAKPLSPVNISIAASMAVQDALEKPTWDPPDRTSDSMQVAENG